MNSQLHKIYVTYLLEHTLQLRYSIRAIFKNFVVYPHSMVLVRLVRNGVILRIYWICHRITLRTTNCGAVSGVLLVSDILISWVNCGLYISPVISAVKLIIHGTKNVKIRKQELVYPTFYSLK